MGKIVKFCSKCDEGFAEKFGFCPNCGQSLQAFEMNPLATEAPVFPEAPPPAIIAAAPVAETVEMPVVAPEPVEEILETVAMPVEAREPEVIEPEVAATSEAIETAEFPAEPAYEAAHIADEPVLEVPELEEPLIEEPAPTVSIPVVEPVYTQTRAVTADTKFVAPRMVSQKFADADDGFHVTVIEDKNVGKRRLYLLGSLGLMLTILMSSLVYNLFSKDLEVGSINDDIFNAVLVDNVPMTVEEEQQQKKDKDAGGGGGGGRQEKEETTQGDLADQSKNPTRPPDAKVFRSDNFELKMPPPQTEGNQTYEKKFDRWGDPNGRFASFSNGTGSGGGQGSGTGTGQGSGRGTGNGSGNGSGSGGGLGDGNGNGTGSGDDGPPPPPKPVGVTQAWRLISKPRPGYTDAARQANVQGTVILRVTFLASGQVGSISTVKGLSSGLTEQAIAAARSIRFEPAKVNGVAQTTVKQIEYSFSIY